MMKQKGLTLIELMVGIAIFAITLTYAVPNFRDFMANNKIIGSTNDFVSSLIAARAEAAKQKVTVTVCGSSNGTSCNTSNWEEGVLVFTDVDADGTIDAGDEIILYKQKANKGNTIRALYFTNLGRVQYSSKGLIDSSGTFKICDSRGVKYAKAININATGRTRLATDDNASGIYNDSTGVDIVCP